MFDLRKANMELRILGILHKFAEEFASQDEDDNWWGHDTDLGPMTEAFEKTLHEIMDEIWKYTEEEVE